MSNAVALAAPAPALRIAPRWRIEPRNLLTLARKEVRDSLRNRWFILYTIAFSALALGLAFLSTAGAGQVGLAGFGKTAASMINLVMLIVPLMGLSAGANALAGERERGTLNYLLAQPLGRVELILGKYLGLALALAASLAIGFGLSAAVLASRHSGGSAAAFLTLVVLAMALALAMLSLGLLLSTVCRKASTAAGAAIFLWLFFAFFGDLGLMGGALALRIPIERLFHIALANPLQVFKIAAIPGIGGSIDVLGPAGLYATRAYGSGLNLLLGAAMGAWIVLPLALSGALFIRRRMP